MRAWSASHLGGGGGDLDRLRILQAALADPGPHALAEVSARTPTAAEAFANRQVDCVGYALLFVALAREAGIAARFALSPAVESVDDSGRLRIERRHLVAAFGDRVFDLGGESPLDAGRQQPIGDRTALALFFSNRGAQALAATRVREALDLLYRALRLDPALAAGWTNLGVALRRAGDPTGAVMAYEMALRIDPDDGAARRDLDLAGERHVP
jgi:tetratricopeptide (TPR) repeat protein